MKTQAPSAVASNVLQRPVGDRSRPLQNATKGSLVRLDRIGNMESKNWVQYHCKRSWLEAIFFNKLYSMRDTQFVGLFGMQILG